MLRWVKGYDRQGRLLLPPPTLGGSLPTELTQAYHKELNAKLITATTINKIDEESAPGSEANVITGQSAASLEQNQQQRTPSHVKLSTFDLPQNHGSTTGVGTYESKTPQPSMTALLSHPELSIIGSISALTDGLSMSHPDIDISPVYAAIARYLGIDLSPEALEAESRRGISIIVHGPPSSGRTTQAKILGDIFKGAVLAVDEVLIDAISSASTPAGCRAREICIQAAQAKMAAALAAAEIADVPSNHSTTVAGKKQQASKDKDKDKEIQACPSLPQPPKPFPVLPLADTQYAIPEGSMLPTVLPEELVAEILSDRLQCSDCLRGIIFDSVESHFTSDSLLSTALILRALNNRKHIYFVNFDMEFDDIKSRLDEIELARLQKIAEEENLKREEREREEQRIEAELNMDEDEYEALSEEKKQEIEQHRLRRKQERRQREREEREERERIERELREEEERRLEEEKLKKKGKKDSKKQTAAATAKPPAVANLIAGGGPGARPDSQQTNPMKQPSQVLAGPHAASVASIHSGMQTPTADGTPKKQAAKGRKNSTKSSGAGEGSEDAGPSLLEKKYNHYQTEVEKLLKLLGDWDRQKGVARPKLLPEFEEVKVTATPLKRGKGSKTKAGMIADEEKQQSVVEAPPPTEESREGLGVPVISVKATQSEPCVTEAIFQGGLPSADEILKGMGEGPGGRPIPDPMTFQVYPMPLKRRQVAETFLERFAFIAASPDDP